MNRVFIIGVNHPRSLFQMGREHTTVVLICFVCTSNEINFIDRNNRKIRLVKSAEIYVFSVGKSDFKRNRVNLRFYWLLQLLLIVNVGNRVNFIILIHFTSSTVNYLQTIERSISFSLFMNALRWHLAHVIVMNYYRVHSCIRRSFGERFHINISSHSKTDWT